MMSKITCADIFHAVFLNIKKTILDSYDTVSVKSKTISGSTDLEKDESMARIAEPFTETNVISSSETSSGVETVKESIERVDEKDVILEIEGELANKFPFALGVVCGNLSTLDKQYRKVKGLQEQGEFSSFYLDVEEDFPLSDRFAYPCVLFVSSMMLIDVDDKVSDAFYEKYADVVSKIVLEIPFENGSTEEKYPY